MKEIIKFTQTYGLLAATVAGLSVFPSKPVPFLTAIRIQPLL